MEFGNCKLCLKQKKLLNKSHIIPAFMYRKAMMFDEHKKIYTVDTAKLLSGEYENQKAPRQSSGYYEKMILCQNCDCIILKHYEDYGKKILYDNAKSKTYKNSSGVIITECVDISYKELKLFFLSILWRAHISQTCEIFKGVNLPDEASYPSDKVHVAS